MHWEQDIIVTKSSHLIMSIRQTQTEGQSKLPCILQKRQGQKKKWGHGMLWKDSGFQNQKPNKKEED